MATEYVPNMDKLIKDFGKQFHEEVKRANKTLEQVGMAIKKYQESEEKSMLHNVTVKHEENKELEQYWEMVAKKEVEVAEFNMKTGKSTPMKKQIEDIKREELGHEPTPQEIAQFLSDSKADFVSVVQNYRFENELPF